jgi:hypothetical protein
VCVCVCVCVRACVRVYYTGVGLRLEARGPFAPLLIVELVRSEAAGV